jgi:O-succinylbenzoate synthase
MRIESIEVVHVAMPLIAPWRTAYGEDAAVESVLVCLRANGLDAWSESTPLAAPCYSAEWAAGVYDCVKRWLAPALVGKDLDSGGALQQAIAHFKGNPFAKAALDNAWWALESLRTRTPLYRLLGAKRDRVDVGADFGVCDSLDDLVASVGAALAEGFKRVKLKFRPGWDEPMLAAVRGAFPAATIHIDCNAGYTLADLALFKRLDRFNLAMIEQPLGVDDLAGHARLQSAIATPVCLDESITSVSRAQRAIDLGSCRYVNIKPGRVGGLTPSVAIHDVCRDAGIPCWVGGMLESAIGARVCVALAMLDNFTYPADIFPSSRFYRRDLATPPLALTAGRDGPQVEACREPGAGAAPDLGLLASMQISRAVLESRPTT